MIDHEQHRSGTGTSPLDAASGKEGKLPYRIELWHGDGRATIERVLALAFNAVLARAVFKAARKEHPDRRITLRRGSRIIDDSERAP